MKLIWVRVYLLNHDLVLLFDNKCSFIWNNFQVGAALEDHPHAADSSMWMLILSQCMEAVLVWMAKTISRTCVYWCLDHLDLGIVSLIMAGVAFPFVVQTASA